MFDEPKKRVVLEFDENFPEKVLAEIRDNLSAVVLQGDTLWLGGDEGTQMHRMSREPSGDFGLHQRFDLKEILEIPGPENQEIDIEGLAVADGFL